MPKFNNFMNVIINEKEEDMEIITQQQHLINNASVSVRINVCQALKANGTQCTHKPSEIVDGEDVSVHVCGTHSNVFTRNGVLDTVSGKISVINQMVDNNNKEEVIMQDGVYMLVKETWYGGGTVNATPRIITNSLLTEAPQGGESESDRYFKSLNARKPYANVLALISGSWDVHLIIKRLHEKGFKFRIIIFSNKEIAKIAEASAMGDIQKIQDKSCFSFANDSHTFFFMVEGVTEWGTEFMGIHTMDVPKIAKRLAEMVRITELFWYSEDSSSLKINVFDLNEELPVEHYDGSNAMTVSCALRMTHVIADVKRRRNVRRQIKDGTISRVNARLIFELGLAKGDFNIVPDNGVWDVRLHPANIKAELASTGWMSLTAEPHNPWHMAVWDDQSWINNRTLLTEKKQISDLNLVISDIESDFAKGEVPDWLLLGEDAHLDDGTPNMERLSEMMDRQYVRWQAADLDIKAASNLVFMATNGILQRMSKFAVRDDNGKIRYFKKTWTPMTNAFLAGVMTRESLVNMAGVDVPEVDHLLWDAHYGLIMSGDRFTKTYALHGGWDLDDSVKVILVKVHCSDVGKLARLTNEHVIDENLLIPKKAEDAVVVALLVRSPNGPGEYSIEKLQDNWQDLPWFKFDENTIPMVDLADAPEAQSTLLENVTVTGVPSSLAFTRAPLTKEQCWAMIEAQRFNPGIGAICNCLMNWAMTNGASFPQEMLAVLEEMVDATQQGRDPVTFDAINNEVDSLYRQLVTMAVDSNLPVDRLLGLAHPIPLEFRTALKGQMMDGRFTRYNKLYLEKYNYLMQVVRNNSLQMRAKVPMVRSYYGLNVTSTTKAWAKDFYARYSMQLSTNDKAWDVKGEVNPFTKMHYEFQKSAINKKIVAVAIGELRRSFHGDDLHKRILSLWQHMVAPAQGKPLGRLDRLMFQPGENDESLMDLLIDALRWHGKIS